MPKQIGKIHKMVVNGEMVLSFDITKEIMTLYAPLVLQAQLHFIYCGAGFNYYILST
jgi:hypothetical protein